MSARALVSATLGAMLVVLPGVPAAATTVRVLSLPAGLSVAPESETRSVSIARDGVVAAKAVATDRSFRIRALRWTPTGTRTTYVPSSVETQPDPSNTTPGTVETVTAAPGVVYVTASSTFSGAYSGVSTEVQRWPRDGASRWPTCWDSGSAQDEHVYGADDSGQVALTLDMTGAGSYLVMQDDNGRYAPYAFRIDRTVCRSLGRAVVMDVRGAWSSGYRGYLDGHLAPTNLNVIVQQPVAVRWHGTALVELGEGDALAVNATGFAVGASAVPGRFETVIGNFFSKDGSGHTYHSGVPHAVAWDERGGRVTIEDTAQRSVAYDVANDGTAVGMLQTSDGRHYAFRWRAGRLERLDDLPHPAGWRFESAHAIAADGTIVGIGTLRGIATVFAWHA